MSTEGRKSGGLPKERDHHQRGVFRRKASRGRENPPKKGSGGSNTKRYLI